VASSTRTRYAKSGGVDVAYQVLGDGPIDLLVFTGWMLPIDCLDEEPAMARFQRRLASFGRLIRFDTRGVGLSDRGSAATPPTREDWAQDALAVLDAVGGESAAVVAPFLHVAAGLTLTVAHPERVSGLILIGGAARIMQSPDYPYGLPDDFLERVRVVWDPDAVELGYDAVAVGGPSVAADPAFRAWWDRAGNLGATPAMAEAILEGFWRMDVRHLLSEVQRPTLVIQRVDIPVPVGVDIPVGNASGAGHYLAEHIAGAKCVDLPGADLFHWVGDTRPMLDEIEEFLTGVRGGTSERVLATVLFTDIVGSTDRAAQLGDRGWRDLLDRHDQSVRTQLDRFRGREINTTGDGVLATFDSPGRAIECALAIRETLAAFDIGMRAGIHTGEIEVRGDDVAGLAVHIGARVSALAEPGEVLVSSTVKDIVVGSSIVFSERGQHELKGVPGTWRLYAVNQ
jgi:class 3 adenylate cyclase